MAPATEESETGDSKPTSGRDGEKKATWKLDVSLDEVIEKDFKSDRWNGGHSRGNHSKDGNYWEAQNGWSYRSSSSRGPGESGKRKWDDNSWDNWNSGGWSSSSSKWSNKWDQADWKEGGSSSSHAGNSSWNTRGSWNSDNNDWGSGGKRRKREEDLPQSQWRSVKVSNIPERLPKTDVKKAFENATGRIASFEMDRGVAWISFYDPKDAIKAADTFDRGELNGNLIEVRIIP